MVKKMRCFSGREHQDGSGKKSIKPAGVLSRRQIWAIIHRQFPTNSVMQKWSVALAFEYIIQV